ncbi:hypothetical protein EVAR_54755_1 [Eumeta japonica]|uniref:Secreted protein n=1 Tax=Eumeta variegata TaxID=151549 RepID=A0A4C1YAB3_EUMVA|nr:hypothetical protein EVAR_54755_1 [Eumeta japonica]
MKDDKIAVLFFFAPRAVACAIPVSAPLRWALTERDMSRHTSLYLHRPDRRITAKLDTAPAPLPVCLQIPQAQVDSYSQKRVNARRLSRTRHGGIDPRPLLDDHLPAVLPSADLSTLS